MAKRKDQTKKQKVATSGHKESKARKKLKRMVAPVPEPTPKPFDPSSVVANALRKNGA